MKETKSRAKLPHARVIDEEKKTENKDELMNLRGRIGR